MLFNYVVGTHLSHQKPIPKGYSYRGLLIVGVLFNLSLLGYFKYSDFFLKNINGLFSGDIPLLHLALPLAISFYTFQQIAYLVDSYRGETREYDFLNYALFVTFFPQLIAGPIVHHSQMMPQFAKVQNKVKNYRNIALGLFIFSMGLFKKVAIADSFAMWASEGFDVATKLNMVEGWITSLSYTFQLYFDFSGYTDMAIGIALLFNISLPSNFNSPYKATSIQDFWRRWHITLSNFLREYIYIPLGGNRKGELHTYLNLFVTFLLGGIWHGAGWTFVFWGMLHGIGLMVHRAWQRVGFRLPTLVAWFITFNFINIAWVFFRAKEWSDAIKVLSGMFGGVIVVPSQLSSHLAFLSDSSMVTFGKWSEIFHREPEIVAWIIGAFGVVLILKNSMELRDRFRPTISSLVLTLIYLLSIFILYRKSEFIYFNF
jgi:D-alanyl-lipoteichoic acid acyltransferase DltB (MBOAT superfamily)